MNPDERLKAMLLKSFALLYDKDPDLLVRQLSLFGFQLGDVTFRLSKARPRHTITMVHKWPWEQK